MSRDRRRSRETGLFSRRRVLLALGAGATGLGLTNTAAFSSVHGDRSLEIGVTSDPNAIVGLSIKDPVNEGIRQRLVDITNRVSSTVTFTLSLADPNQGTLYSPSGFGDTVDVTIASGNTKTVEIEPENISSPSETVNFTITGSGGGFAFDATRSTTADANDPTAIDFSQLQGYRPQPDDAEDNWYFKQVQAQDNDGDSDLSEVKYVIRDEAGTQVATDKETTSDPYFTTNKYQRQQFTLPDPNGNTPDYDVKPCELYSATVQVFDADNNVVSRTATGARPLSSSPIEVKKIQNFSANAGADNWTIGQVQIQDKENKDLSKVVYEVYDPVGTLVGKKTVTGNFRQQYQDSNITINPEDAGYDVVSGQTYTVKVTGVDDDGNEGCDTRKDTA